MNLRKVGKYNIGLDIGTGSVGWAVTDEDGELCYFKGKPTWGSRTFPNAQPASEARAHRSLRRRYTRRKWRLNLLQDIFAAEIEGIDPDFFIRMNQSALLPEDRDAHHSEYTFALFNDAEFNERDYFKKFPTIYHLRKWLMDTDEKADIRLIYLAFHNIVKHRGNFLRQENKNLSSSNANVNDAVERFCFELQAYCDELGIITAAADHVDEIAQVLSNVHASRSQLQDELTRLIDIQPYDVFSKPAEAKAMAKALAASLVGLSVDLSKIFYNAEEVPEGVTLKVYLSNDEQVEAFEEVCSDNGRPLFEAMKGVYSSYVLQEILSSVPGGSISVNKVADYDQYGEDLRLLKQLVKEYIPAEYDAFFRGEFYTPTGLHPQKYVYDKSKAQGYTKYNEVRGWAYGEFRKSVEKLFAGSTAIDDPRYIDMMNRFANGKFLRRLKTSDNGSIPFQLNLEEMDRIIENQQKFYPFLKEDQEKLDSLVTFRIPYYVGPLTQKNARRARDAENGDLRFAWSERIEGKENDAIKPWNWEEIIDKDKSAAAFIQRMTGTCTYLQGEPVLPKSSLLYEEYCVLNELNGSRFTQDGDSWNRFDYSDRDDIVKELFRKGKVSYKKVADWMRARGNANVHVRGGQGETGYESRLGSYIFFSKDVFGVDEIPQSDYPMIEEIILWSTLFEDRTIFKEKLEEKYGDRLSAEQIKKIVKKRFTGWGRLSRKLLTEMKTDTDNGPKSIMDILREGNPNNSGLSKAMIFMEIIHDDNLGFNEIIDAFNKEKMNDVGGISLEELPGSPALRRSINQALEIVDEIVHIAGHAPENIFIEVTREDDLKKRGSRTKRRYDNLKEAMKKLKEESPEAWSSLVSNELSDHASRNADLDERLTLYFMQGGKSLYSGAALEIGRLSEYEVDHILPQSYIKDDSFENKALVLKSENQNKSDQMLLPIEIRKKMKPYWDALLQAGLIGKKKHANLLRDSISEKQMKGFIARQLIETSQIMKLVQGFLEEEYSGTRILPVKATLSHELRESIGLVKCREINDFHHAHDALLASEIGRFIQKRHPGMYDNPIGYTHVMKQYVKNESDRVKRGRMPGSASFVVASFMRSGFDEETGELFKDDWSAEREIAKLKKYFDYRQCFISRMPEETSGAFWDQTIYSPRDTSKNMTLPLKKGMDPEKYGSYSREQFAYFFIYKALKKGQEILEFAPVPVSVASEIRQHDDALEEYASELAIESELEFVEIVRPKIYKYQLIEIDGSKLYLTGKKEVRNAVQFAFNMEETQVAKAVYEGKSVAEDDLDKLFLMVVGSLVQYSPKLFDALGVSKWKDKFFELSNDDRATILKELIAIGDGKTNVANLANVGGAKFAGRMLLSFGSILTKNSGITFIDQSITGMFERRTHIGL